MPIYAFGATPEGIIRAPAQIYTGPSYDDTRVAFHSWTHTVLHTDGGLLELPDKLISPTKAEVVGTDKPLALLQEGRLRILPSTQGGEWDAVAITDAGPALGVRAGGVYALPSLVSAGFRLEHPLLRGSPRTSGPVAPITVVATESRAAILAGGEVLEAIWDWRHPGAPRLEVVEELCGLGVCRLVAGRGNRLGAVTGAGEGYLLEPGEVRRVGLRDGEGDEGENSVEYGSDDDRLVAEVAGQESSQRTEEPSRTEVEAESVNHEVGNHDDTDDDDNSDITDLGLGPDFELAISSGVVWARGNNDFGQLGQGHTRAVEGWVRVTLPPARRVFAGRFSAVVECVE